MINLSVTKKNHSYVPNINFAPNASLSLKEMASIIYFLQSGILADQLFTKAVGILTEDQIQELIKYITMYHTDGSLSDDKKMMESLLMAAKIPVIDNEGLSNG
jgi:Na+-translocating ferredoxin:NAD+ oxidoreductase RnfD subunit